MNISDATKNNILGGMPITDISIKAVKASPIANGTQYEINLDNGVISNIPTKENSEMTIKFEGCNDAVMDGTHPFYFSVLPFEITGTAEETAFDITINTKNGSVIKKILQFGNLGTIKFEAGKYTTLNISIKDEDVTNAAPQYTKGGGVITMHKAGSLTSRIVAEAMATQGITIKGDINATDIQAIKNVMNGTEPCSITTSNGRYNLNLRDANIVAGGTPFKTFFQYQPENDVVEGTSETKDNTLPKCFIDNKDTKVGNILLPSSLTTLDEYAIWINERYTDTNGDIDNKQYNRTVNVSGNIETINGPWVRMYNWPTIYFAINPPAQQKGNWNSGFNGLVAGKCNIIAYRSWKDFMIKTKYNIIDEGVEKIYTAGENGMFFNKVFHSIRLVNHEADKDYFVENIYNAIDYKNVVERSEEITLRGPGTLTAWMIKKTIGTWNEEAKVISIAGNIGASDIAAIKTVTSGQLLIRDNFKRLTVYMKSITNDEGVEVPCNIVDDGTKYIYHTDNGEEKSQLSVANTISEGFYDNTDIKNGTLQIPSTVTTIKTNALKFNQYNYSGSRLELGEKDKPGYLTTLEKGSIKGMDYFNVNFIFETNKHAHLFDKAPIVDDPNTKSRELNFLADSDNGRLNYLNTFKEQIKKNDGLFAGCHWFKIHYGYIYWRW